MMAFKSVSIVSALIVLAALPSAAAEPPQGCFARTYDAAHLSAHKGQNVVMMAVDFKAAPKENTYPYDVSLTVRLKGEKRNRWAVGGCSIDTGSKTLSCPLDEDSGIIGISFVDGAMKVTNLQAIGVTPEGESPEDGHRIELDKSNPENRVFLLRKGLAKACT